MADARDTKKQENGSRLFFESVIEKGKEPTIPYIEKNAYEDMPASWFTFYQLQAQALKKYLGNNKGYKYSRDNPNSIMPFIEKLAAQKMGVSTKDRWNPMDIIMVKTSKEAEIRKKIQKIADGSGEPEEKLVKLNIYMAELLTKKDMIPISLKGLAKNSKEAKLEEANMGSNKTVEFKLKPQSLKCDLDMTNPPLFDTGEFSFRFFADKAEYGVQIRSFRYSMPTTGPQTDITPKSGGAKLGKVSTKAIEPFLADIGLERPLSVVQDPMINANGNFTSTQIKFWVDFYQKIQNYKIDGQSVNWDQPLELGDKKSSFEKNLKHGLKNAGKDRNALGRITSKLFTLRYIEIYYKISQKKKFKDWLSTLYYGAKKEFSDLNGPFIKIY